MSFSPGGIKTTGTFGCPVSSHACASVRILSMVYSALREGESVYPPSSPSATTRIGGVAGTGARSQMSYLRLRENLQSM